MRHYKKGRKLGTDASHTKAMKKSLVSALLLNDRIKTVEARAKEVRGDVDKVIGWAKRGDIHSRRLAIAALGDKDLVREIFEKVAQGSFKDRAGGYTRIMKLGNRKGDNASMVIMELVTEPVVKKADKKAAEEKKTSGRKAKPVKASEAKAQKAAAADLEEIEEEIKEEAEAAVEEAEAAGDEEAANEAAETAADAAQAEEEAQEAGDAAEAAIEEAAEEAPEEAAEPAADEAADAEAEPAGDEAPSSQEEKAEE